MTNDDGRKPEGAPERSPKAGAGAPSGVDGNGPKRFSVQRKMAIVAQLLRGEPLELVARESATAPRLASPERRGSRRVCSDLVMPSREPQLSTSSPHHLTVGRPALFLQGIFSSINSARRWGYDDRGKSCSLTNAS
jgi:hypothetical protein